MRRVNPGRSFQEYLSGKKLIEIVDEKPITINHTSTDQAAFEQYRQLAQLVKQYREQQKAYFAKLKKNEFAKDEQHFMMKTQEKIDNLLKSLPF